MTNYQPAYIGTKLKLSIKIEEIVSVHYFEYMKDFFFEGERHNFWEFLIVDKGEVDVTAEHTVHNLKKGQMIFHAPNEFHSVRCNGKSAPDLVVISFKCSSPLLSFLKGQVMVITEQERSVIAAILQETRRAFDSPLDDPWLLQLSKRKIAPIGSEQLIAINLELFLISAVRRHVYTMTEVLPVGTKKKNYDEMILKRVLAYFSQNLSSRLSLGQICSDNMVGRSQLLRIFREIAGCGVIEFFSKMKIEKARQLIREGNMNFTQISEHLGYSSLHYFSRQFRKYVGMTPTEYSLSIMAYEEARQNQLHFL